MGGREGELMVSSKRVEERWGGGLGLEDIRKKVKQHNKTKKK